MKHSMIQLDDLPDEILIMIFKNMCQADTVYSLIGVNQRFNTIVYDSIFTNHLTLFEHSSDGSICSFTDSMLEIFCSKILPKINHKIKYLHLESSSMERILLATNYPSLYGLCLYNINLETAKHYFFTLSTLLELHVSVTNFSDCLYLLDGRFNQLHTFYVNIAYTRFSRLTINNTENLPNLKVFSLSCKTVTFDFDELIVPLLHRMINLEELGLFVKVRKKNIFVDGNDLKKNIINKMSRLNNFQFDIRSTIHIFNQINLPFNKDIQYIFKDFHNNLIISYVDYFSETQQAHCRTYSYPYLWNSYCEITNNFPSGLLFKYVLKISLHDERPFEHEFFLRIAQSFPLVKYLTLANNKPQNDKQNDDNKNLPIIKYPHLTALYLIVAHIDYIEQFLLHTKTHLSNNVDLFVVYHAIEKVTENFTRNTTRINCEKLNFLGIHGIYKIPQYVKEYFPNTEILNCEFE
ncbi:unnamed protein product [Rotaria sordida]|uniref:F-box domain-containing protein n=1 Tax=Rotaria sordida TaxID=392033 RepID=A0A815QA66_9BILA|nr:unnamed protein product [Rotaria sordida]